jgi:hypothetical protein
MQVLAFDCTSDLAISHLLGAASLGLAALAALKFFLPVSNTNSIALVIGGCEDRRRTEGHADPASLRKPAVPRRY